MACEEPKYVCRKALMSEMFAVLLGVVGRFPL